MPEDSELNDEDFDAQFQQNPEEDTETEAESPEEPAEEVEPETETEEKGFHDSGDDDQKEDFDKPVSEGEVVELEIKDLGSKGDVIARKEGFVIFVPGGEVDQTYDVEITSVGRKFAFGEIAE